MTGPLSVTSRLGAGYNRTPPPFISNLNNVNPPELRDAITHLRNLWLSIPESQRANDSELYRRFSQALDCMEIELSSRVLHRGPLNANESRELTRRTQALIENVPNTDLRSALYNLHHELIGNRRPDSLITLHQFILGNEGIRYPSPSRS